MQKVKIRKDVSFYVWMAVMSIIMAVLVVVRMQTQSVVAFWLIIILPGVYMLGHWLGSIYFNKHYPNDYLQ